MVCDDCEQEYLKCTQCGVVEYFHDCGEDDHGNVLCCVCYSNLMHKKRWEKRCSEKKFIRRGFVKADAIAEFSQGILKTVYDVYGTDSEDDIKMAWDSYVEGLLEEGIITEEQHRAWSFPSHFVLGSGYYNPATNTKQRNYK